MIMAKKHFIVSKLGCKRKDPKKLWREMGSNLKIGKHAPSHCFNRIRDKNGTVLEGKDAGNYLNKYYTSIAERLHTPWTKKYPPLTKNVNSTL